MMSAASFSAAASAAILASSTALAVAVTCGVRPPPVSPSPAHSRAAARGQRRSSRVTRGTVCPTSALIGVRFAGRKHAGALRSYKHASALRSYKHASALRSYTEGARGLRPVTPTKGPPTKAPATKAPAHEGTGQESTGPRGHGFRCLQAHGAGGLDDLLEGGRRLRLRTLARRGLGRDGQDVQLVRPGAADFRVRPRTTRELEGAVPGDRQQAGLRVDVCRAGALVRDLERTVGEHERVHLVARMVNASRGEHTGRDHTGRAGGR